MGVMVAESKKAQRVPDLEPAGDTPPDTHAGEASICPCDHCIVFCLHVAALVCHNAVKGLVSEHGGSGRHPPNFRFSAARIIAALTSSRDEEPPSSSPPDTLGGLALVDPGYVIEI